MKALVCILVEIGLLLAAAYCLVDLWGWFLSPLGAGTIIVPQAVGIMAIIHLCSPLRGEDETELLMLILEKAIRIALVYFTGYLASTAM